jgi:hypothetical protein
LHVLPSSSHAVHGELVIRAIVQPDEFVGGAHQWLWEVRKDTEEKSQEDDNDKGVQHEFLSGCHDISAESHLVLIVHQLKLADEARKE